MPTTNKSLLGLGNCALLSPREDFFKDCIREMQCRPESAAMSAPAMPNSAIPKCFRVHLILSNLKMITDPATVAGSGGYATGRKALLLCIYCRKAMS